VRFHHCLSLCLSPSRQRVRGTLVRCHHLHTSTSYWQHSILFHIPNLFIISICVSILFHIPDLFIISIDEVCCTVSTRGTDCTACTAIVPRVCGHCMYCTPYTVVQICADLLNPLNPNPLNSLRARRSEPDAQSQTLPAHARYTETAVYLILISLVYAQYTLPDTSLPRKSYLSSCLPVYLSTCLPTRLLLALSSLQICTNRDAPCFIGRSRARFLCSWISLLAV